VKALDRPEPVTPRGRRVFLILAFVREHPGVELHELRDERPDLWPRGHAGDRKWTRDKRDARSCRVYAQQDVTEARRIALLDLLEDEPGLDTSTLAARLDTPIPTLRHDLYVLQAHGRLMDGDACQLRWWAPDDPRVPRSQYDAEAVRALFDLPPPRPLNERLWDSESPAPAPVPADVPAVLVQKAGRHRVEKIPAARKKKRRVRAFGIPERVWASLAPEVRERLHRAAAASK